MDRRVNTDVSTYTDTTVQPGTTYIYRVRAVKTNEVKAGQTNPAEVSIP